MGMFQSGVDYEDSSLFTPGREDTDPRSNPAGLRAPGETRVYSAERAANGDQYMNPLFRPEQAYLGSDPNFYLRQGRKYGDMAQDADIREAPMPDYGFANQSRGMQLGSLALMRSAAMGGQPSAAEAQYRLGMNQAGAAAGYGLAGGGSPLAMANAQRAGMGMGAQGMTSAGIAAANQRSQEEQRAIQAYTQGGLGMRNQDIGQSAYDARQQLLSRNLNDQRALGLLGMEQNTYESQRNALMKQQAMLQRAYAAWGAGEDARKAQRRAEDAASMDQATGTLNGATMGLYGWASQGSRK